MAFFHAALTKERVRVAQLATLYEKLGQTGSFVADLIAEIELDDEATLPNSSGLLRRYLSDHPEISDKSLETAVQPTLPSRRKFFWSVGNPAHVGPAVGSLPLQWNRSELSTK